MSQKFVLVGCLGAVLFACGPAKKEPELYVTFRPSSIDNKGAKSVVTVSATNDEGKPGAGTVMVKSEAGSLKAGQELTLDAEGLATVDFTCKILEDPACNGRIEVTATWSYKSKDYTASAKIQVGIIVVPPPQDGGSDGGPIFVIDGGVGDAGTVGVHKVTMVSERPTLVAGGGDNMKVTATVTVTATGAAVVGTPVVFTTTLGSFTIAPGTVSKTVMTDANGKAEVQLFVAGASEGIAVVNALALDADGNANVPFSPVGSIVHMPDPLTKAVLGIQSSGRDTTTPIFFRVLSSGSSQKGVPGVLVLFEANGPANIKVSPEAVTDINGVATAILQSGDEVGSATVTATVASTKGVVPEIKAVHPGTPISGGKPSDQKFRVECVRKNLGVMVGENPPLTPVTHPNLTTTTCTATLVDRNSNTVLVPTSVLWFAEAGQIDGVTNSATTGLATAKYSTVALPPDQDPFVGEPSSLKFFPDGGPVLNPDGGQTTYNPRDNFVTIIGVVSGEEAFDDGSGISNGVKDGKWNPGEWFTDLAEPFLDTNDNNAYDEGEYFLDTDRVDCANPTAAPTKNNKWDGPNGCWDGNTQIWRSIHIIYSGAKWAGSTDGTPFWTNTPGPMTRLLASPTPGDNTASLLNYSNINGAVGKGSFVGMAVSWTDLWYNGASPECTYTLNKINPTGRGDVVIQSSGIGLDGWYHGLAYRSYDATESATVPGQFTINGPCDSRRGVTPPPRTRCIRRFDVDFWARGNVTSFIISGANPADMSPTSTLGWYLTFNHPAIAPTFSWGMSATIQ